MQNTIEFGSGDNTTTSTSSQPELQHAPVNRVTMKPPPFYRTNRLFGFDKWNPSFCHLAHNHPPHRETNSPTRVRGNDWGSYLHPPCRPNQLTEDYFHRRHWIYGINHQINARQRRLRHADSNKSQNSKRRLYQSSRKNDAHNCHTLPPTRLQFHLLHRRRQQHSRTGFPRRKRHKYQLSQLNSNRQRHKLHFNTQQFTRTAKSKPCSSCFCGPVSNNRHSSQKDDGTAFISFWRRRLQHAMYSQYHSSHRRFIPT